MVHKIPVAKYGEHSFAAYCEEENPSEEFKTWEFYDTDKKEITDFWKLPTFHECSTINLQLE
jgi:hypothetical protein